MAEHIVIIGAGECGGRAALSVRDMGFEGSVTLIGSETVAPYERPPLSKDAILFSTGAKIHRGSRSVRVACHRFAARRVGNRPRSRPQARFTV